jgi:hypothetical protein
MYAMYASSRSLFIEAADYFRSLGQNARLTIIMIPVCQKTVI